MKLRTFLSDLFGGIKEALSQRSQVAAVIHGLDTRAGKRGARGKHDTKNPFRGIACKSPRKPKHERRIEGARDSKPSRSHLLKSHIVSRPAKDTNPTPCQFLK